MAEYNSDIFRSIILCLYLFSSLGIEYLDYTSIDYKDYNLTTLYLKVNDILIYIYQYFEKCYVNIIVFVNL